MRRYDFPETLKNLLHRFADDAVLTSKTLEDFQTWLFQAENTVQNILSIWQF